MSKIKDEIERTKQTEYEAFIAFMEWVCDQQTKVSETDVKEVEEDTKGSSTQATSIVHQNALNNTDYNPKLGA